MNIKSVKALANYQIAVSFEDGVSGIIALNDFIEDGIFRVLKNEANFQKVYTDGCAIAWSDELEIDGATVYEELLNKEPASILPNASFHATD